MKGHYQSELTQFLNTLLKIKPQLAVQQKQHYAQWWTEVPIDLNSRAAEARACVTQSPYVYGDVPTAAGKEVSSDQG